MRTNGCGAFEWICIVAECARILVLRIVGIRPKADVAGRKPFETVKARTNFAALYLDAVLEAMGDCMGWIAWRESHNVIQFPVFEGVNNIGTSGYIQANLQLPPLFPGFLIQKISFIRRATSSALARLLKAEMRK